MRLPVEKYHRSPNYERVSYSTKTHCALCEIKLKPALISLLKLPLTEIYSSTKPRKLTGFVDQYFHLCTTCGHGQISRIVNPQILYGQAAYFFRTSHSASAIKANDVFYQFINKAAQKKELKTIIEIGCSDLYLLLGLKSKAKKLIGIDPILRGQTSPNSKIQIIPDFFENSDLDPQVYADSLVISSHTLEHVENPKKMLQLLFAQAHSSTLFIFQFPGFEGLVTDNRYDQIFHQHLHYFSLDSFIYLLNITGGELVDYAINYKHWGSLMVVFRKKMTKQRHISSRQTNFINAKHIKMGHADFQERMKLTNKYLRSLRKEHLYGYGAALMLPILGYHLNNDFSQFQAILDDDSRKAGKYYINLPVKISQPDYVSNFHNLSIVITALNTSRPFLNKVLSLEPKRIIFPLPYI